MRSAERTHWQRALVALALALPIACSPGGDGGGIGGSGLTVGSIDGFGSVILNGRRFDTDTARIVIENEDGDQAALSVGMLVRAEVDFAAATASTIAYDATLRGPIEAIDAGGELVTVLGQRVRFDASTVFEGVDPVGLTVGRTVEISGLADADGNLVAGFVRARSADDPLQTGGTAAGVASGATRFRIGALEIDYGGADLGSLDTPLRDGLSVIVSAPPDAFDVDTRRLAAAVVRPGTRSGFVVNRNVELEGIVTSVDDPTRFVMNGQVVAVDANTRYTFASGGVATPANVTPNTRVEVNGRIDAEGTLAAARIVIVPAEESRLIGPIESVDPAARTLVVLGVPALVTARTRITGDAGNGFGSLREGMYVRLDAAFTAERLAAVRIDVEEADEEARLRGPVTGLDLASGALEILGVSLVDGADTDYELSDGEAIGRRAFLARIELGDIVTARWREYSSTAQPPDDVELELD